LLHYVLGAIGSCGSTLSFDGLDDDRDCFRLMDKMTTGTASSTKRAKSGNQGLVGGWPPASAAGAANLNFEFATTWAVTLAPLPVPPVDPLARAVDEHGFVVVVVVVVGPLLGAVVVVVVLVVVEHGPLVEPEDWVPAAAPPPLLAAAPPAALPIGGTGGGDEYWPSFPLKVGLLQFAAVSCCGGWFSMYPTALSRNCDNCGGNGA
jgi:hypothetical protein